MSGYWALRRAVTEALRAIAFMPYDVAVSAEEELSEAKHIAHQALAALAPGSRVSPGGGTKQ